MMTNEEIKKKLDCTARITGNELVKSALNLITEQEKEIERLKTTLCQCNTELNSALESLKSQCREIGELKAENERFENNMRAVLEIEKKQAKIEVLNELKEKIVEHMGDREYMGVKYKQGVFSESEIDEMIAEVRNAEDKS